MVRAWCVLYILTSKCASRHNGVHFSNISTSKSGPTMVCFVHFDFEMCFAPQRRALFRHLNFQKCSETQCVLYLFTWKCASRHNGVQFFISHLASWLRTRHFGEPTFRPSGATNHWKQHSVSRLSYLFAHLHLLSSDSFSSTLLSSNLSLLSASSLLCFSSCRKFDFQTSFDDKIIKCPAWAEWRDATGVSLTWSEEENTLSNFSHQGWMRDESWYIMVYHISILPSPWLAGAPLGKPRAAPIFGSWIPAEQHTDAHRSPKSSTESITESSTMFHYSHFCHPQSLEPNKCSPHLHLGLCKANQM